MKVRLLLFLFMFLACSLCFGEMSIYLKNGGEHRVRKIVFKGQQADLYLPDGRILTLPVSGIDLPASGIGSPVGTYGETQLGGGGSRFTTNAPALVNEPARQEELKHEWDSSEKIAVAQTDIGRFHAGEVVHIVEKQLSDQPPPMDYYWNSTPMNSQVQDQAYVVIYRNVDGSYGKKMIDAATFATNFKIQTGATLTPPKVVTSPSVLSQTQTLPMPTGDATAKSLELEKALATPKSVPPVPEKSNWLMITLISLFAVASGAAVFVAIKKRAKPFIDTSKFRTYESELRDFEMEIWLKNGKTLDQLIDICVKKFYQDNPAALSVAMKMVKGQPKNVVMPYLIKQSERSASEAEGLYADMEQRLDWIRQAIQTVSGRTGVSPQSTPAQRAATPAAAGGPPPLPPRPAQPETAASPQAAPVAPSQPPPLPPKPQPAQNWEDWGVVVDLEKAEAEASGIPEYMKTLHSQLGTLGF